MTFSLLLRILSLEAVGTPIDAPVLGSPGGDAASIEAVGTLKEAPVMGRLEGNAASIFLFSYSSIRYT